MTFTDQFAEFQRKARDAEVRMAAATDPFSRAEWARIAMGYRDLMQTVTSTAVMAKLAEQPSPTSESALESGR